MMPVTAEQIFNELLMISTSEQEKFFNLLAKKVFSDNNDENLSHEELFGDLKDAEFTTKAVSYLGVSSATFRRYVCDGKITPSTETKKDCYPQILWINQCCTKGKLWLRLGNVANSSGWKPRLGNCCFFDLSKTLRLFYTLLTLSA